MKLDDLPAPGQAEPSARFQSGRSIAQRGILGEKAIRVFLRQTRSGVMHFDTDLTPGQPRMHLDLSARRAELKRVAEQIVEHLRNPYLIDHYARNQLCRQELDLNSLLTSIGMVILDGPLSDLARVRLG